MLFTDASRVAHQCLSSASVSFLDYVERTPECLERASFKLLAGSPFPDARVQPWPTFASTSLADELRVVTESMDRLIKDLPARVFNSDPERVSRFYEIDLSHACLLIETPHLLRSAISRLDCILTPDGVRCIEINSGSHLDAWFRSVLADLQVREPLIDRFLQSEGIGIRPVRTGRMVYEHFLGEIIRETGIDGATINFGLVVPPSAAGFDGHICPAVNSLEFQEALTEVGIDIDGVCLTCSYAELASAGAGIMARDTRLHGLYELTPLPPRVFTMLSRASMAGRVMFFSGLATAVLSDKRNLVLLSDPAHRSLFSVSEQEFLDRHVPWTRTVREDSVVFRGQQKGLSELLLTDKDEFVLKRGKSTKRDDIWVGKFTQQDVWTQSVKHALEEGCWIVQEYLTNRPLNYQSGPVGTSLHELIYGCFAVGGRYAGTWLRMDTLGKRGVINASYGAHEAYLLELAGRRT